MAEVPKVLAYPARVLQDLCRIVSQMGKIGAHIGMGSLPPPGVTADYRESTVSLATGLRSTVLARNDPDRWGLVIVPFPGSATVWITTNPNVAFNQGYQRTNGVELTLNRITHHTLPTLQWYGNTNLSIAGSAVIIEIY